MAMFHSGRKVLQLLLESGTGEAKLRPFKDLLADKDMESSDLQGLMMESGRIPGGTLTKMAHIILEGLDLVEVPNLHVEIPEAEMVHVEGEWIAKGHAPEPAKIMYQGVDLAGGEGYTATVTDMKKDESGNIVVTTVLTNDSGEVLSTNDHVAKPCCDDPSKCEGKPEEPACVNVPKTHVESECQPTPEDASKVVDPHQKWKLEPENCYGPDGVVVPQVLVPDNGPTPLIPVVIEHPDGTVEAAMPSKDEEEVHPVG